jgi:hypothetical protein
MTKYILYIAALLFLTTACTEEIDVNLGSTYTRLVVDGNIEADSGKYRINLTKSADYFYNEPVPRVNNATVSVYDGLTSYPLTETIPGVSGIYETGPGFKGQVGLKYTLNVNLNEPIAGTSTYEASCELKSVTRLDSIRAEFHPEWGKEGFWTVKLWAQEPGDEENFYLFNLYRNGVLMSDTIWDKVVSDDIYFNGSYMDGFDVFYIDNSETWETLHPGDTITMQMSGITKEYYQYIMQVQQAGFNIPFFSGPPANVVGNINNGGVGFFAAWSNSFSTAIVR